MAGNPGFQALTLTAKGLLNQIISELTVSAAYDPKNPPQTLPPSVSTQALWDTGASKSVLSQNLVKTLGLVATGATNVNHAGGMSVSPTHVVNFYLPNKVAFLGVVASEFPGAGNFGAIIGMDVIRLGDLVITNFQGQTCMSFRTPSLARVDYVEEHNRALFKGVGRNDLCPCGSGQKFKKCHGA